MELRHLRYFVAVAEELHFNRAAQRLQMAQPPLSAQIIKLERELGVKLLHRSTRSVRLTEAGSAFLVQVQVILRSVDEAADVAIRASRGLTGRLRVGFSGAATYSVLPVIARAFREAYPEVLFQPQGEMLNLRQLEALSNGELDACFVRATPSLPDVESKLLRREGLVAVLPDTHPLAHESAVNLADLADDNFLAFGNRLGTAMYDVTVKACAEAGFVPRFIQEVMQTGAMVSLVAAGFGVAIAPASVRNIQVTGAVHRPLAPPSPLVDLRVAWRRDKMTTVLENFLLLVDHELGERD